MKVSRIVYAEKDGNHCCACCSVVLDDCLKLTGIMLCKKSEGYYLILPSKQDIYKTIKELNDSVSIKYPVNLRENRDSDSKKYEDFYYPVTKDFYNYLLEVIIDGYNNCLNKETGKLERFYYRP